MREYQPIFGHLQRARFWKIASQLHLEAVQPVSSPKTTTQWRLSGTALAGKIWNEQNDEPNAYAKQHKQHSLCDDGQARRVRKAFPYDKCGCHEEGVIRVIRLIKCHAETPKDYYRQSQQKQPRREDQKQGTKRPT